MLRRFLPITNLLQSKLGFHSSAERAAERVTVLQDEEIEPYRAIALPGQLEKVTSTPDAHELDQIIKAAQGDVLVHAPVVRYEFNDCIVHPWGFDCAGFSHRVKPLRNTEFLRAEYSPVKRAVYCNTFNTVRYFGHWLQEACPAALLGEQGEAVVLDVRRDWPDCAAYLDAFQIEPHEQKFLRVEKLALHRDFSEGSHKRGRYRRLRARLDTAFAGPDIPGDRIYFRRGLTGVARIIANEAAVIDALVARGFAIFEAADATPQTIYNRFRNAKLVVSIEGSHLNHLYYALPPEAGLLALLPAAQFTANQIGFAAAAGLKYGFLVMDQNSNGNVVNIAELVSTIDLMER